jgi:osmotically-inducible protein OsmY
MFNKMRNLNYLVFGMLCGLTLGCSQNNPPASADKSKANEPTTVTAHRPIPAAGTEATNETRDRTNTGVNDRDRNGMTKTPIDQKENKADINITADIRKRVVEAELSVDAQNVKIITQNGRVTLRGPVKTEEEKQKIEKIASEVAGSDKVDNQLEVNKD